MITGTAVAADGIAYTTALTTSATLNILGIAANSFCSSAYAGNEPPPPNVSIFVSSKPAIWVNYADPRPKGDDADNGAAPSYIPQISINNVSLMPVVSIKLFSVNSPVGPADISPILTYSPPILSKHVDDDVTTYSIAMSPGSFGNCWSDNLTPCVERSCNRKREAGSLYYERTLSVNGPIPSASFKGTNLLITNTPNFNCSWTAQPLTKASAYNNIIEYWGSGLKIDESGADSATWYTWNGARQITSYTKWTWPRYIYDRNGNNIEFLYSSACQSIISLTTPATYNYSMMCAPTNIRNLVTGDQLSMKYIAKNQNVNYIYSVLNNVFTTRYNSTTFLITNITHSCNNTELRSVELSYMEKNFFVNGTYSYKLNLLSSAKLPNGDIVSFEYTDASLPGEVSGVKLPLLTRIISPGSTNVIKYGDGPFDDILYQTSDTWKYEPPSVCVITDSGLTTNEYEIVQRQFNLSSRSGHVIMETTSPAGAINEKRYDLFYEPINMQWYGCETENTLDVYKQYSYSVDSRFRYTSVSRYPLGANDPSDTSSFKYDSCDNLTNAIDAYDNQTHYYYATNLLDQICTIDSRGIITSNIFDNYGNLLKTIEDFGGINRTSSNLYNEAGQVIKFFDPLDRVTRNYYATNGTPQSVSSYTGEPDTNNFGYLVATRDPLNRVTTFTYDKLDRVIASVYMPYDNNMPVNRTVTPLPAGLTIPTCDTSLISGGFDDQLITYEHDKVGNVLEMADWAVQITNAYDALNRKITEYTNYKTNASLYHTFYSEYDLINNRVSMVFDAPGDYITQDYSYDNLNRLSSLSCERVNTTISVTNTYNQNNKIASITAYENGNDRTARNFSYDSEQRLISIIGKYNNNTKLDLSYKYNNAQQITNISETYLGSQQIYSYVYDDRDQLTKETISGSEAVNYSYDLAQNRMSKYSQSPNIDTYSYVIANKLTNIYVGSQSANNKYFYDIAGNLTSNVTNGKIKEYYYNAQNKLVKIIGSNFVYEFSYDSQNRRIGIGKGTNDSSLIWRYTIHDGNLPIGEITVAPFYTDVSRWFVRGVGIAEGTGDMIADMILEYPCGNMKSVFYLSNHRGDTMLAYRDDNGTDKSVATYQYDAFGNFIWKYYKSVIIEGQYTTRFLFSTKEFLFNADLYLYAYRVYDPIAGRWTQRDPIDYQDSINLYQFCGNNPVNKTDADGRKARTYWFVTIPLGHPKGTPDAIKKAEKAHEKQHRKDFWNCNQFKLKRWQLEQRAFKAEIKILEKGLKDPNLSDEERKKIKGALSTAKTISKSEDAAKMYTDEYKEESSQKEHSQKNTTIIKKEGK